MKHYQTFELVQHLTQAQLLQHKHVIVAELMRDDVYFYCIKKGLRIENYDMFYAAAVEQVQNGETYSIITFSNLKQDLKSLISAIYLRILSLFPSKKTQNTTRDRDYANYMHYQSDAASATTADTTIYNTFEFYRKKLLKMVEDRAINIGKLRQKLTDILRNHYIYTHSIYSAYARKIGLKTNKVKQKIKQKIQLTFDF